MPLLKIFFHVCIVLLGFLCTSVAWACSICAPSAEQNSLVYRLITVDSAMLAKPSKDGKLFSPLHAIKGEQPKGAVAVADNLASAEGSQSAESVLLFFNPALGGWLNAGAMPIARLEWLRQLTKMRPTSTLAPTEPSWPGRVALFVKDLEHPLPLLAQGAYDEIAVAPYSVMRTLQPHLSAVKLNEWVQNDALIRRRSLYNLLLGFVGDKTDVAQLEQKMQNQSHSLDKADLSSMMAAYIEMRGSSGVDWIEANYLKNKERSDMELQAAVMALTVHGNDGVKVTRERVIQSYAAFIKSNPSRAGFVASDLGNWERWEFVNDYMALLKSGVQQAFASRYAVVLYLMRSPSQEARNALEQLRAEGIL